MDIQTKSNKRGSEVSIASFCSQKPSLSPPPGRWQKIFEKNLEYQISPSSIQLSFSSTWKSELLALIELEQSCCQSISWSLKEVDNTSILILDADVETISAIAAAFNLTNLSEGKSSGEVL